VYGRSRSLPKHQRGNKESKIKMTPNLRRVGGSYFFDERWGIMADALKKDKIIGLILTNFDNLIDERTIRRTIDEMEKKWGFFIENYAEDRNVNGDAISYKIPLDIAGLISSYIYIKAQEEDLYEKIKNFKELTGKEIDELKKILKENFSGILQTAKDQDQYYDYDIDDLVLKDYNDRIDKIVEEQLEKILMYLQAVRKIISKKNEIRERFNDVVYSKWQTKKYYDPDIRSHKKMKAYLGKVFALQERILRLIQEFDEQEENL